MKKLTVKQRKIWAAILRDETHPWYGSAKEAIEKERRLKAARKFVRKQLNKK